MDSVLVSLHNKAKLWKKKKERKLPKSMERLQNYLTWSTIWAKRRFKQSLSCINDLHGWTLINCHEYR